MVNASIFSILSYAWINPLMVHELNACSASRITNSLQVLGYQRTLQATDLWKMDETRESGVLGAKLDDAWARRVKGAEDWNARLANGEIRPGFCTRAKWFLKALRSGWHFSERRAALEQQWRQTDGRKEASLAWALNDVFGFTFWTGGVFKASTVNNTLELSILTLQLQVIGDTSQLMGPIIVRVCPETSHCLTRAQTCIKTIINFTKERAAAQAAGIEVPSVGRGVGMAIGLFCTTVTASVCQHQVGLIRKNGCEGVS